MVDMSAPSKPRSSILYNTRKLLLNWYPGQQDARIQLCICKYLVLAGHVSTSRVILPADIKHCFHAE